MSNLSLERWISESIREIVFGLEDSLVSTLGALTGIAIGANNTFIVILSGLVILAAECTSMAAGSYLSSKSALETEAVIHRHDGISPHTQESPVRAAMVMGLCYLVGGVVPLLPYFLFPISFALIVSIPLTAVVLFLVGVWSSHFTKRPAFRSGVEMAIISLSAALIGYVIARAVNWYFGINV
ncbi:VIT1/CCC1 transporter family protein [Candidatus Uhrbacteria bacterium]|nr:VIT1/CCC1 transporter family protein [Candidatus Uhrbacteria bacterium]